MSEHDKEEIAALLKESSEIVKKWSRFKILAYFIPAVSGLVLLGIDIGNWQQWRDDVNVDRQYFKNHIESVQAAKNQDRADYNKSIVVKTPR